MHKGSIVLIPFPFTNLSGQKIRPALVLSNQKGGGDCIVSFISSKSGKVGQSEIVVKPSKANGLKVESTIKVDKIATLSKKIILGEIGEIESIHLATVDNKIRKLFDIK